MLKKSLGIMLVLVGVFVFQTAMAAEAKVSAKSVKMMKDAQALVKVGKYADAYTLMAPFEFEKSGDVTYDYLLGISAVNASKPDRATLALERVEAVSPQYGEVRLWLGIAYFQSGDSARSKKTFESLLKQPKLSQQSKSTADQYLLAIKQQEDAKALEEKKAKQPYLIGMVELGMGVDSNITSGPKNYVDAYTTSFSSPPQPPLPPSNVSARFAQVNGNLEGRFPFSSAGTYAFASFDSTNRTYAKQTMMNSHANTVKGGVNVQSGMNTYRFDIAKRDYRQLGTSASLGYTANSSQNAVTADARFGLTERDYLGVSLQYNMPRYPTTDTQDTNQIVLGTNYTHVYAVAGSPMIYLAMTHTRDKALKKSQQMNIYVPSGDITDPTDVSRNTNAFIAYTQYTPVPSADITAMWMLSMRRDSKSYARSNLVELGKDDMQVAMLGVNWRPATNWLVKPQLMHIRNKSNIALYAFQKTEVSVSVKREFK
ncbi:MAG: hypothetical protein C0406_07755 [Sideroxydans sp.]|nr:hypothetical protein [Sideroxydans sp.]